MNPSINSLDIEFNIQDVTIKSHLYYSYNLEPLWGIELVPSMNPNFCLTSKAILITLYQDLKLVLTKGVETKAVPG